jgi:hypothetical protein
MPDPGVSDPRCRGCGLVHEKLADGYCLECLGGAHRHRAGLDALVAYVRDHPGITVGEAARAVGVTPNQIRELIEAGRLETP